MFGQKIGDWAPIKSRHGYDRAHPHVKVVFDLFDANVDTGVIEDLTQLLDCCIADFFLELCFEGKISTGRKKPTIADCKLRTSKYIVEPPLLPDTWNVWLRMIYSSSSEEGDVKIPYNFCITNGTSTESLIKFAILWNEAHHEDVKSMCIQYNEANEKLKLCAKEAQKEKDKAELAELERLAKKHKKALVDK